MACRAFDICNDAAQRYLKDVKSERYITQKNVQSLKEAKREIEALTQGVGFNTKNENKGDQDESYYELLGQAN